MTPRGIVAMTRQWDERKDVDAYGPRSVLVVERTLELPLRAARPVGLIMRFGYVTLYPRVGSSRFEHQSLRGFIPRTNRIT